jgi:dipeptidyl aminopeptidase/acylaminoacyl peptidase
MISDLRWVNRLGLARSAWLWGVVWCSVLPLVAAESRVFPVEHYAHSPLFDDLVLSPDGEYVVYAQEIEGRKRVMIRAVGAEQALPVNLPAMFYGNYFGGLFDIRWASAGRILIRNETGYWGIDRNGRNYRPLSGPALSLQMGESRSHLWLGRMLHRVGGRGDEVMFEELNPHENWSPSGVVTSFFPNVLRVNTRTGAHRTVLQNPGGVVGWYVDRHGEVRMGLEVADGVTYPIYRPGPDAPWRRLRGIESLGESVRLLGIDETGRLAYLGGETPAGRMGIHVYHLDEDRLGDLIAHHDRYDLFATMGSAMGVPLQGLIRAHDRRLLGIRYVMEKPGTLWLDPTYAQIQATLDQALPGRINTLVGLSESEEVMLFLSWSSRHPGTYYRFDRRTLSLVKMADRMPWIQEATMAEMRPIRLPARDGVVLHGYVTLPPGAEGGRHPLVMMPHGGPWVRDVYQFDPLIQFLASRGYAVLQVNYRGSAGYGREFMELGYREIGGAIQRDIADAVDWAIKAGLADPDRVAILGASFGGYSALMGVVQEPELYRAAVSIAGVSDWASVLRTSARLNPFAEVINTRRIGDPRFSGATGGLDDISPLHLAERIKAPVLLIHGRDDPVVPHDQATRLATALTRAGNPPERLSRFNEPHGIYHYKNRMAMYALIEDFLGRHLTPPGGW